MIVILTGHKFAGKDTFARGMQTSSSWKRLAFADAVRAELLAALSSFDKILGGTLRGYLQDPELKETVIPGIGVTGRTLMQNWGTSRRLQDPDYWVNKKMMSS